MTNIRNFGIIAHIDAGKTTTTERLLFLSGASRYLGEVDEGTTVTDYLYEEREHGITIQSAAVKCKWKDTIFHIIDTPGHVDFMIEVERCLQVLDSAVVVLCGQSGIQAQTENLLHTPSMQNKPLIFYINKLDKPAADFERVFYELQEQYPALPVSLPYYIDDGTFAGVIDLIREQLVKPQGKNRISESIAIPENARQIVDFYKKLLIDTLTEKDEYFLEEALQDCVTVETICAAIRRLTISQKITPVFAGSSRENAGISLLADGIKNYLPSPSDVPESTHQPAVSCFKYLANPEFGRLRLVKLNRNTTLRTGMKLFSSGTGSPVIIHKLFTPFGGMLEEEKEITEGGLAAIAEENPLSPAASTLYLSEHEALQAEKGVDFTPRPIIFLRIEPECPDDREKFHNARKVLLQEDPTLSFREDKETGEMILGGMGELHLEIFQERLLHSYGIRLHIGRPAVIPKITPAKTSIQSMQSSFCIQGQNVDGKLSLGFLPLSSKESCRITGECNLPQAREILSSLLSTGREYEFIGTEIYIQEFQTSTTLSAPGLYCSIFSGLAAKIVRELEIQLLYPQMELEIFTKPEYTGNLTGEIQARHGAICDISRIEPFDQIIALAPMSELFGFATRLRSLSCGHASFSMKLHGYTA